MKVIHSTIGILFLVLSSVHSQKINQIKNFLDSTKFERWEQTTELKSYNSNDLFDYMDGGAVVYLNNGFINLVTCKYSDSLVNIRLEIYEFEKQNGASILFSKMKGEGEIIDQLGIENIFNPQYVIFYRNNYLIFVSLLDSGKSLDNNILEIAQKIDSKLVEIN